MSEYKIISADTHIVEPPDLFEERMDHRFRDRAPRLNVAKNEDGINHHAWFVDGKLMAPLGVTVQTGRRFDDPDTIDWLATWPEIPKAGYEPGEYLKALEEDGLWGGILQPSVGLVWWRIEDSALCTAIQQAYNDWIADFANTYPKRLKGMACINVDNVIEACEELERCRKMGLTGAMVPVYPGPDRLYSHPIHERLWWTAQDLEIPLCLHVGTNRGSGGAVSLSSEVTNLAPSSRATNDYWVRFAMCDMIFAGVFDRFPKLKVGSVEHEMGWIPHWLNNMDFTYRERPVFTDWWKSKSGLTPSEFWHQNMFVTFTEDDLGVELRDKIGVDNMLWGNDYPHAESSWPRSMEFLDRILADMDEIERRKVTSGNVAKLFGFDLD